MFPNTEFFLARIFPYLDTFHTVSDKHIMFTLNIYVPDRPKNTKMAE